MFAVQVVGPSGRVTYLAGHWMETEDQNQAVLFHGEDNADLAADLYRLNYCRGQSVIIQAIPFEEGD